jgi:putative phosphoesterase
MVYRVGVISDTHGLLRPEAFQTLKGADHIIHAGDIGSKEILAELATIAPVSAVRGNTDTGVWARGLPQTAAVEIGGMTLYVIHDIHDMDLDPLAGGFSAVICGHSHRPMLQWRNEVLYFNPGSAGPRRFRLPVAVGQLTIKGKKISAAIIPLQVGSGA